MYARRIKAWFSAADLVLAVVTTAVRILPLWPEVPSVRECFLIAIDVATVYGAVWAAGWGLARSYRNDDQQSD
jgi:hypothetical protein